MIGQAIALASAPFISRLYSPQDVGTLGAFASALALTSVVASLRFEVAIPAEASDADAAEALTLAVWVSAATSIIFGFALWIAGERLFPTVARSLPGFLLVLLPVAMLATALFQALSMWMIRTGDFGTLSQTRITQSVTMVAAQLVLGWRGAGAVGLIVGQILGSCGGLFRMRRRLLASSGEALAAVTRVRVLHAARRLKRFPQYSAAAVLLDASIANAPLLFVAAMHGMVAAGFLTLVQRWLFVPLNLLVGNIAQVFFSDLALMLRTQPDAMRGMFTRRLRAIVPAALLLVICLALIVPYVVGPVFGERWASAGHYFVLLSPLLFANIISSPFGSAVDVLQRQDLHLAREVARATMITAMLFAARITHASVESTLILVSVAGVFNSMIYLFISWLSITQHVPTLPLPVGGVWNADIANRAARQ